MKKIFITLMFILILGACDNGPSKEEIKTLCKSVGDKAFALANDGTRNSRTLEWIEQGAAAECELKYLTKK
jgi:hypothetical protein